MALPPTLAPHHKHITERESAHTWPDGRSDDGKWEDCAWCALIMFLRVAYRPDLPATHAFMESIRARVMGPLGGTVPSQLIAGAKTIGVTGPGTAPIVLRPISAADLWTAMNHKVACVSGSMGAFPSGHTLRRWDPGFAGAHQVFAYRPLNQDRVWWDDPLAPTSSGGTRYVGQWVTKADFLKFVTKLNSVSFVAPPLSIVAPAPDPAPEPDTDPAPEPAPEPTFADGYTAGWNDATTQASTNLLAILPAKR